MIQKLHSNSSGAVENSSAADDTKLQREIISRNEDEKVTPPSSPSSPPSSEEEVFVFPLSFAQQRLWFLDQLIPNSAIYNISGTVQFHGRLVRVALEESFKEIVRRHEVLRTTFAIAGGQPVQAVASAEEESTLQRYYSLEEIDLRYFSEPNRQLEVQRLATAEARLPFNLEQGPLLRVMLLHLAEQQYTFLVTIHHIISDGWSLSILMRELMALYEAFSQGNPSPLPDLAIQYADFALWQREWLQGELLTSKLAYWQRQLSGCLPVLQLPTSQQRPAIESFRGARQLFNLSANLTQTLKTFARQEGVTLFMTLLAVFKILLYRYTAQSDILVGSPIANRQHSELESVMGFFVNTLVLRTDLSGNPTFRQLLVRVREMTLEADAHQDVPFEKLVEALQLKRELSWNPLFQVAFVIAPPMPALTLPWSYSQLDVHTGTAKFDLTLALEERPDGLLGAFEYNTDLFAADAIARMVGHFQTLLKGILTNPDQPIGELPLLTQPEWQQMQLWNHTQADYPDNACIHQLFAAQVEKTPDAVAVVFADNQLTYRELNAKANQLAHYLQTLGVGTEVLVGICVERSLYSFIGILGILKAGGAYLPLDPAYPSDRLAFMLQDAQVSVLLTQSTLIASLPQYQAQVICLDTDWKDIARFSSENPDSQATSDSLAYAIYTSGSTGKPKGVEIQHRGLVNLVTWHQQVYNLTPSDRATQLAGLAFDASVWEVWPYLSTGASIYIPDEATRSSPAKLVQWLTHKAITVCFLPTPLAEAVLLEQWSEDLSLRFLLTGGDRLHPVSGAFPFSLVNHYGPTENTVVTTSATVVSTTNTSPSIGRPIANTQVYILDSHLQPVPVGVPGEIYIGGVGLARGYLNHPELTSQRFISHPFCRGAGEAGEQGSRGAGVQGSRGAGEAGGELLTPNSSLLTPHSSLRLYKTGDLARYLSDGNIEYLGRLDNQVKIRGFRIELGEIEAVLSQHPDVREAVVIARENISGDKGLVAYVGYNQILDRVPYQSQCLAQLNSYGTVKVETEDISVGGVCLVGVPETADRHLHLCLTLPDFIQSQWFPGKIVWQQGKRAGIQFQLSSSEQAVLNQSVEYLFKTGGFLKVLQRTAVQSLRSFLKKKLPDYMVPHSFVFLNALPQTPNGKVDRHALPAPEALGSELDTKHIAPQTEIEQAIAAIWQQVLLLNKVGLHDNFFDLGGHSLRMAQVYSLLGEVLQEEVSMLELFQYPTVSALAKHLSQKNTAQTAFAHSQERANKQKQALHLQKQKNQRNKQHG
ncbi:amino acid adenylation domain-containing protein [Nostoc sp. UHCC 0702]|nr:amino acid adenylation domain-containing protein [Nostoc sp. UHCC 0702]